MGYTFHLIANAHLDPVWLWDWREGLNEGLVTCRTILDLMDEDPELTFIRGEAAVYEHIERHDPETFTRIVRYIEAGRWDVVGGTYVQPDTNLPATETFARHFLRGQSYFASRFGRTARVAWAADSFGHSAGLPLVLAEAGIEGFAFTRPGSGQVPLAKPAFWWEGPGEARVLGYRPAVGWYGCERDEMPKRLDGYLRAAREHGLDNVGVFYGVGNHGGGPTRRQIADIRAWAERHGDEVRVIHSGLHRLFDALRDEVRVKGEAFLPAHRGELNFCLRGCYASVAKFKFAYRRAEASVARAERTGAAIAAALGMEAPAMDEAWDAVLFNAFHDILPGSSIERAFDDQIAWIGGAVHASQRAEMEALNALARRVDTSVPSSAGDHPSAVAFLVWNPHPHPFSVHIELEGCLDYRPIWAYNDRPGELPVEVRGPDGTALPFQTLETENRFTPTLPWRRRVLVPAELPPVGWSVLTMAWVENPEPAADTGGGAPAVGAAPGEITNGVYTVRAQAGSEGIEILRGGEPLVGVPGLSAITVEDPWGSWGGMGEEPDSLDLSAVRDRWTVEQVATKEIGPERAALWVRLAGGDSRLDLTLTLSRGRDAVDVWARVLWNERAARLKLVFPGVADSGEAEFDVPGGSARRGACGEVPGGRWVRCESGASAGPRFGFASDALYGFDLTDDGALRASVVRASGYSQAEKSTPDDAPWHPVVDAGELRFRFLLTGDDERLPILARELEEPPVALLVPPSRGDWPRSGSLGALFPPTMRLLALKPAEDGNGWIVRVQETAGVATEPTLTWLGRELALGTLPAEGIATWRLLRAAGDDSWQAEPTNLVEGAEDPNRRERRP